MGPVLLTEPKRVDVYSHLTALLRQRVTSLP